MARRSAVCAIAIALSACDVDSRPIEVRARTSGGAPIGVRAIVQAEHRRDAPRYVRAAVASVETLAVWLGPYPHSSLTLIDPSWHGGAAGNGAAVVLPRTHWWTAPTAMTAELAAARAIARRWWTDTMDAGALPVWFVDGVVEYSARRVVTPLFQSENLSPGYAMVESRYFGQFVPRFFRFRLLPESDGEPLQAYRTHRRVSPLLTVSEADRRSLAAKAVLTLNTLERWLSRPMLDGVLAAFASRFRGQRPVLADFTKTASDASGQDLSWLLEPAFGEAVVFDYAVTDFTSRPNAAGSFDTTVSAARLADGLFTGTAAPRIGSFENGRGIAVAVTFEGGDRVVDMWDGRDMLKTFVYRSATRAVSAAVDPEKTLLLDLNRANNSRTLAPRASGAATRWSVQWLAWLQNVLLTYALFA